MRPKQLTEYLASATSLFGPSQPTWGICSHDISVQCTCSRAHLRFTVLRGEPRDGIGRLPTETLTEIFLHALSISDDADPQPDSILWERIEMAKVILAVCGRWRNTMVQAHVFSHVVWNKIPTGYSTRSMELLKAILERSRQQSLSLNILYPHPRQLRGLITRQLTATHDRLEALRISGWRGHGQDTGVFPDSMVSFPRLHTLVLDSYLYDRRGRHPCHNIVDENTLGRTRLPALRALRIIGHIHLYATQISSSLQELHLNCVRHFLDLALTLVHLPHLRILGIDRLYHADDCYDDMPSNEVPTVEGERGFILPGHIALEELDVLTIRQAGVAALETLLNFLRIPESSVVYISCFVESERDQEAWPGLVRAATHHLTSEGDFAITCVDMETRWPVTREDSVVIRGLTEWLPSEPAGLVTGQGTTRPHFTLQVSSRRPLLHYPGILVEVASRIPSDAVTGLCIRSSDVIPQKRGFVDLAFPALFACFPDVDTLEVFGNVAPALYALSLPQTQYSDTVVMRCLRGLYIYDRSSQILSRIPDLQQLLYLLWEVRAHLGGMPHVYLKQTICAQLDLAEDDLELAPVTAHNLKEIREDMQELVGILATRHTQATWLKPENRRVRFAEEDEIIHF